MNKGSKKEIRYVISKSSSGLSILDRKKPKRVSQEILAEDDRKKTAEILHKKEFEVVGIELTQIAIRGTKVQFQRAFVPLNRNLVLVLRPLEGLGSRQPPWLDLRTFKLAKLHNGYEFFSHPCVQQTEVFIYVPVFSNLHLKQEKTSLGDLSLSRYQAQMNLLYCRLFSYRSDRFSSL